MKRILVVILLVLLSFALVGCDLISVVGGEKRKLPISGQVIDDAGQGVKGLKIMVDPGGFTVTDDDGNWGFNATKGAKVDIEQSNAYHFSAGDTVREKDQKIDFYAQRTSFTYTGRVVDAKGEGIPSVTITFTGALTPAVTDKEGVFSKGGLPAVVTVEATREGYVFTGPFELSKAEPSVVIVGESQLR